MRLGLIVNLLDSPEPGKTTYRIAWEAARRGHEVWVTSPANFIWDDDDQLRARMRSAPAAAYASPDAYLSAHRSKRAIYRTIAADQLDCLLLRNNPVPQYDWARQATIDFGRLAMRRGSLVISDPNGLAKAANKLYLNTYPAEIRPRTLVARDPERVVRFLAAQGRIVVKPLAGYGGQGVFLLEKGKTENVPGILESIARDGFIVAQEYLPEAAQGDTRFFMMNGNPLVHRGKHAAFRRIRSGDDVRSNIHSGGRLRRATVTDAMQRIAEIVRPRLVEDGMFLVGLDIVGNKVLELNVFSPGGLGSIQKLEHVDFAKPIVDSIEQKVQYHRFYRGQLLNCEMCTL